MESHSRCACEYQSRLKIEAIRVIVVHSSTTQIQKSSVDKQASAVLSAAMLNLGCKFVLHQLGNILH